MIEPISAAPRLLVMKIMACEKSTRRLSPGVRGALFEDSQQQVPQRVRWHPGGEPINLANLMAVVALYLMALT